MQALSVNAPIRAAVLQVSPLSHHDWHNINHILIVRIQRVKARSVQTALQARTTALSRRVIMQLQDKLVAVT
jgi:hypothetical protein